MVSLTLNVPEPAHILYQPARFKVLWGGRGSGKSTAMADAIVVRCVQGTERVLCTREIQRSIKSSVHQLLKDRIEAHNLSDLFTVTDQVIRGHNGSLIQFAGLRTNPESIKSMEGITICWCEEANSISQRSLDLLIPTVRKPGSEIWFSFNRHKPTDPVDNMFLGGEPPPETLMKRMNWSDNRWFPDVLRDEILWISAELRQIGRAHV